MFACLFACLFACFCILVTLAPIRPPSSSPERSIPPKSRRRATDCPQRQASSVLRREPVCFPCYSIARSRRLSAWSTLPTPRRPHSPRLIIIPSAYACVSLFVLSSPWPVSTLVICHIICHVVRPWLSMFICFSSLLYFIFYLHVYDVIAIGDCNSFFCYCSCTTSSKCCCCHELTKL